MKYKSEKTLRRAKKAFSLIELMIVIVIIGALTAIILPQFDISEAEAKDAGCDASNYGTLAQLTKFRSLYGVYPARMHTGLEATATTNTDESISYGASDSTMGTNDSFAVIPSFTKLNMNAQSVVVNLESTVTDEADEDEYDNTGYADSLRAAGIVSLAYGGFPTDVNTKVDVAFIGSGSGNAKVLAISDNWYEAWDDADGDGIISTTETGKALDKLSAPISINGIPLPYYMFAEPQVAYAQGYTIPTVSNGGVSTTVTGEADDIDGIVVPLILAPTTDWDHWYDADGNQNDSKIGIAQVGACPWLEAGAEFRYYIAIFKVYADGETRAKLLGTMCPEGGSLNP